MKNSGKPVLTLFVAAKSEKKLSWTLDPQGRNTFRIVIVCGDEQSTEPCTKGLSAAQCGWNGSLVREPSRMPLKHSISPCLA